jgi:hypothetical protein
MWRVHAAAGTPASPIQKGLAAFRMRFLKKSQPDLDQYLKSVIK